VTLSGEALCATCHGDGAKHVESGGDVTLIQSGKGAAGGQTCLTCHDKSARRTSMKTGVHAPTETVSCQSCHSIHGAATRQPHLLKAAPASLCASCHSGPAAALHTKPFAHRTGRGGADCVTCHDPHAGAGKESLRMTRGGELPCLSCHTEKKGPFAYEHVVDVVGDCTTCHEPHGSVNPKMLNRPAVDQLCLQCHSRVGGSFLGSQPPSFHDLRVPRYRNCTTCHTAIHGSNRSPLLLK
jgi:DmsE family decaheme c-type cytochrome